VELGYPKIVSEHQSLVKMAIAKIHARDTYVRGDEHAT
jgi:hypothetical protein